MSDLWSWNNAVDADGTLISSTAGSAGGLSTSNLRDPRVGKIWRAASMPATLNIALAASGAVSMFGVFGHNYAALGTMTLKLGTSEGAGDLWEESFEPVDLGQQAVFVLRDEDGFEAAVEATHATITVETGSALEIGRIWLGAGDWVSGFTHAVDGSGWSAIDLSRKSRTPLSGAVIGNRGARLRTFTANYQMLDPGEYADSLFEMDDQGTLQQMLFVPNPDVYDPNRFAILGTLDEIPDTSWRAFQTAGRAITITEAG